MFKNREDAAQQLAAELVAYTDEHPLVLGLPRGGVVVAATIAKAVAGELDVLLVKKLRAPGNPELAIGAICEEGRAFLNDEVVGLTDADEDYIATERRERLAEMAEQRQLYRRVRPRVSPTGRTVILVDDGLATGATMIAAAQATALSKPEQLIVAVPVGPPETVDAIRAMSQVDDVVCLETPAWFSGVGQFYRDFHQISDEEVVQILEELQ